MDFEVDVTALRGLTRLLDRLGEDANEGTNYLQSNTELEYGEGLLNRARGSHEEALQQVQWFLDSITEYTAVKSRFALDEAIKYYQATDAASAAELDATYPRGITPDRSQLANFYRAPGDPSRFTDHAEPQTQYRPIPDYNADPAFQFSPQMWDIASPTSSVRDTIWGATWLAAQLGICDRPYDPYESLVKPFSGDWAAVRGCADTFANISAALADMAANLRYAALGIDSVWTGNAASRFQFHLTKSAAKLVAAGDPLLDLTEQYKTCSTAMFEIGKVVGSLISDIVDAALILIAEISLATATSETVVGGVIFGAAALYEGYKLWQLIREAMDLVGRADSLTSAFNATVGDFGLVGSTDTLPNISAPPPLPAFE